MDVSMLTIKALSTQIDTHLSTLSQSVTIAALKEKFGGGEAGGLFRDALLKIEKGTVNWGD